ncbi:MAG: WD40 repeat domain-containing protein, partial [Chloroflexota bacterium]
RDYPHVRSLFLSGLPVASGVQVLESASLFGEPDQMALLVQRYSGNPLALKLVVETVQDFYGGDIAAFLDEEGLIFDDIRYVLDQQFGRLSNLEQDILFWLAILRTPTGADQLGHYIIAAAASRRHFIESLRSLQRRFLIEESESEATANMQRQVTQFFLQNVVMEYMTAQFTDTLFMELETLTLRLFHSHSLLLAQATEPVRQTQRRLLLQPLRIRLCDRQGTSGATQQLAQILAVLKQQPALSSSFAPANLLHLLLDMDANLQGADFSQLAIWQANLRGVRLPQVNFAYADLTGSVFTQSFNAILCMAFSNDGLFLATATTDGVVRIWRVADTQLVGICAGNGRWVWSLCFSPDGQRLATGSADRAVRLWDIAECLPTSSPHQQRAHSRKQPEDSLGLGYVIHTLEAHTDAIASLAFSPDAQFLASGSTDSHIHIWDVEQGKHCQALVGHTDRVKTLCYGSSSQNRTNDVLYGISRDGGLLCWDVQNGHSTHLFEDVEGEHRVISIHPIHEDRNDYFVATIYNEQTVYIWRMGPAHANHLLGTIENHFAPVMDAAFQPALQTENQIEYQTVPEFLMVALYTADNTIRLWTLSTGTRSTGTRSMGTQVPPAIGQLRQTLSGHTEALNAMLFRPDGHLLVSGGWDRTIRLWHPATGEQLDTLQGYKTEIESLATTMDGQTLFYCNTDHVIHAWNLNGAQAHQTYSNQSTQTIAGHLDAVHALAMHPHEPMFVSGSADHTLRLWSLASTMSTMGSTWGPATQPRLLRGHTDAIFAVDWSGDGRLIASGGGDQRIRIWDTATAQCQQILRGHTSKVNVLAFMPMMQHMNETTNQTPFYWLVSADTQAILLWNLSSSTTEPGTVFGLMTPQDVRPHMSLPNGPREGVYALTFSPDGQQLASGGGSHDIHLWQLPDYQPLPPLSGHGSSVYALAYSPDGRLLASGSGDQTIRLWDVASSETVQILRGHQVLVQSLAFHPTQPWLISGSSDETVKIWDLTTGDCIQTQRPSGPYAGLNITGATGLTAIQRTSLKALGAVESE